MRNIKRNLIHYQQVNITAGEQIKTVGLEIYLTCKYSRMLLISSVWDQITVFHKKFTNKMLFSYIFVWSEALFSESVAQWCEQMVIRRSQVWRISNMRQYFPTERLDRFLDPFRCMWWGIIMKKNDCVAFFDNPVVFLVMLDLNRSFAVGSDLCWQFH